VQEDCQATVEVRVDEAALDEAVRWLDWRMYSTNQPAEQLSLEQAVLAYRSAYLVKRSLDRLKGARCRFGRCMCSETTMPPG
jgi:transposase